MSGRSGSARRRHRRPLNADVNVINLVDVMLVLLVIFMVTAPILQGGIAVRLPRAASKPVQMPGAVTVTVQRNGTIALEDRRVSFPEFRTSFRILAATRHPAGVFVRGDAGAPFGDVVRVLGEIHAAGIEKVSLVTEPVKP
ncbi:MAG: biopolymer transporter ExbD [Gemmatimonadales bacterium]